MKEPDVSVIIPCYNIKNELLLNLASFRKQTYPKTKYELVVVNDGSTDGTSKIKTDQFPDLNIKMVNLKKRSDRTIARNRGLDVAEGELIIFCDGDTICYPHFISSHVEQHRKNVNTVVSGMSKWPSIFTFVHKDFDPITKKQFKAFLNQHPKLKRKIPLHVREKIPLFKKEDVLSGKIFKYVFYPKWADNINKIIQEYGLNLRNYPVPWLFFITRNCSVGKEALRETRFDEGLSRWGMDDWQLGYRLHQNGMGFKCTEPTNIHQEHPRNWQQRKKELLTNYQNFSRQFPVLPVYLVGLTHFGWNYYRYSKVIAEYNRAKSEDRAETAFFLKYFEELAVEQHDLLVRYGNRGEYASNWEHRKYLWGEIVYDMLQNYLEELRKTWRISLFRRCFFRISLFKKMIGGSNMLVSIILVTHNSLHYLKDCLSHLKKYTDCPYELIIIDNGSRDGSVEWLKNYRNKTKSGKWMKRLKIIFNQKNRFFPKAVNQGISQAKGAYYALLNADVVVTANWLKNMLKYFELLPDAAAIGPIIGGTRIGSHLLFDQGYEVNYGQLPFQYPPDKDLQKFARSFQKKYAGDYIEAKVLCFACAVLKRAVVEEIGGLDQNFLIRGDDWEWCLRARVAGYRIYIAADTFILHYSRGSIEKIPAKRESKLNKHDQNHWVDVLYQYHNPLTLPPERVSYNDIWKTAFLDVSHLNPQITKYLTYEDLFTNKFPFFFSGKYRRSE